MKRTILLLLLVGRVAAAWSFTSNYGFEFGVDGGYGLATNEDMTLALKRLEWIYLSDSQYNRWTYFRTITERKRVDFDRPNNTLEGGAVAVFKKRIFTDYVIKERLRISMTRLETFGANVQLHKYSEGLYDVDYWHYQRWSAKAVNFNFAQYFGVGGEVWEAYIGYGAGLCSANLDFLLRTSEGPTVEHPEWVAWAQGLGDYTVQNLVSGKMRSATGVDQFVLGELNRRIRGRLYFCATAEYHWVWVEKFSGPFTATYNFNGTGETVSGEGTLLMLQDVVGLQPVVVPNEDLANDSGVHRYLTVDFIGPRLLISLRYFL